MLKKKSWIWWLTIFANPNATTTIYPDVYLGKNYFELSSVVKKRILKHEEIHLAQQKKIGKWKFLFLYIFVLPLFWNKYRFEWEYEAYVQSGTSVLNTLKYLKKWNYGWLKNKVNK